MRYQRIITVVVVCIAAILVLAGIFRGEDLSNMFYLEGIFYESEGIVEIRFVDKSEGTSSAVLEILGMAESFQRTYDAGEFTEIVPFAGTPSFGWKVTPITVLIQHDVYGTIQLKTEIHGENEPKPKVIAGRL